MLAASFGPWRGCKDAAIRKQKSKPDMSNYSCGLANECDGNTRPRQLGVGQVVGCASLAVVGLGVGVATNIPPPQGTTAEALDLARVTRAPVSKSRILQLHW